MLSRLYISNYALIDELEIKFHNGLTVITGETGAGKSIIMGALSLILGERVDLRHVRQKDRKTVVEGVFDLSGYGLQAFFTNHDIDFFEKECIIRREIGTSGRSRIFINDSPVNVATLKELVANLIDIHSQHSNMLLSKQSFQLKILDVIAQNAKLLEEYKAEYKQLKAKENELAELKENFAKRNAERDYIAFQLKQFDDVNLQENEDADLEATLATLSNIGEIKETLWRANNIIDGDGEEASVIDNLRTIEQSLRGIEDKIADINGFGDRMDSVLIELKDMAHSMSGIEADLAADPERLKETEDRLNVIYDLERKYNVDSVAELLKIRNDFKAEMDSMDNSDATIARLEHEVESLKATVNAIAGKLSARRKDAAKSFTNQLVTLAKTLSLQNLQFEVAFSAVEPNETGTDKVDFLFAFNRSQQLMPVHNAASGGEISRLMLCIKSIIANTMNLPTIIFDEIDTGISGDVASKVGGLMSSIARHIQVFAITHLPQVAAYADNHLQVYKVDEGNVTITKVKELDGSEHVQEIARMLSGSDVNKAAIDNAKALIADRTKLKSKQTA